MCHDETFNCHQCGATGNLRQLHKRDTQPGDYCPNCGGQEKCAACGELANSRDMFYKPNIQNYVCIDCADIYHEVINYIKPLSNNFFSGSP